MKAWYDIIQDPNRTTALTSYSEWYVDNGVKIERFNDGRIEIKNTMCSPDHYKDITPRQFDVFEEYGWEIGSISVCIDTYKAAVERLNSRIKSATNANRKEELEEFKNRRDKLLIKVGKYDRRLNKLFLDLQS